MKKYPGATVRKECEFGKEQRLALISALSFLRMAFPLPCKGLPKYLHIFYSKLICSQYTLTYA